MKNWHNILPLILFLMLIYSYVFVQNAHIAAVIAFTMILLAGLEACNKSRFYRIAYIILMVLFLLEQYSIIMGE